MNTMDLKLNREMLTMTRTILDASCEQAVEKDFLLPDYYPDIFRVLKCVITPTVQSHSINGGKLFGNAVHKKHKLTFKCAGIVRLWYDITPRRGYPHICGESIVNAVYVDYL